MQSFRDELMEMLERVEDLPTLPSTVFVLEKAVNDPNSGAEDIAKIMSHDPSLTMRVLRLANSAYYSSAGGPITSVKMAVTRLGFIEIRKLATTVAVIKIFDRVAPSFDHRKFWQHSLTAAISTRVIRGFCGQDVKLDDEEAFVAGLLHDIGVLLLDQYFHERLLEVNERAREEDLTTAEAELAVLGMDHGEVGGCLLEHWKIPKSIVEAVTWHHQPGRAAPEYSTLVDAVHLADFTCTYLGVGDGGDGWTKGFADGIWHDLQMDIGDIPAITQEVEEEAGRCQGLLALM